MQRGRAADARRAGRPPPTTLPKIDRSGVMPNRPCAPPGPTRKPVITSSKTSSAPCVVAAAAQPGEEAGAGGDEAHVGGDRLDEHRGELGAVRGERGVERGDVVVGHDDRVGDRAGRDPGRAGQPERRDAAAGLRRAARRRGRGSSRRTSRSSGGRSRRGRAAPRSSPPRCPTTPGAPSRPTAPAPQIASASSTSPGGRRAERGAGGRGPLHRLDDGGVGVPEDRRAPRLHVVEVPRPVGVDEVRRRRRGPTKNGSPPTRPKARTGEFTPPGMRACARANDARQVSWSRSATSPRRSR